MNDEIFLMIDSYIDAELDPKNEDLLFEQLALNTVAREYFRKVSLIKKQVKSLNEEFPSMLEDKITSRINKTDVKRYFYGFSLPGFVLTAISVILLIISLLLLKEVSSYRSEFNKVIYQVKKQNLLIEALYNSLPPTEVNAQYSNEIIIKPKI